MSDEEPQQCALCPKKFEGPTWLDDLIGHWKLEHNEDLREMLTL